MHRPSFSLRTPPQAGLLTWAPVFPSGAAALEPSKFSRSLIRCGDAIGAESPVVHGGSARNQSASRLAGLITPPTSQSHPCMDAPLIHFGPGRTGLLF